MGDGPIPLLSRPWKSEEPCLLSPSVKLELPSCLQQSHFSVLKAKKELECFTENKPSLQSPFSWKTSRLPSFCLLWNSKEVQQLAAESHWWVTVAQRHRHSCPLPWWSGAFPVLHFICIPVFTLTLSLWLQPRKSSWEGKQSWEANWGPHWTFEPKQCVCTHALCPWVLRPQMDFFPQMTLYNS